MIRAILILIFLAAVYYAVKTIFRSAITAYHEKEKGNLLKGEDMVLDPGCQTYIVRDRAVIRKIQGKPVYFCSEACAQKYQERTRT